MSPRQSDEKCQKCSKDEIENQVMISCDCCELWFHNQCQNLNKTEANLIAKGMSKGIKWFCTSCCPSLMVMKSNQKTKTTDERLDMIALSIKSLNDKMSSTTSARSVTDRNAPEQSYYQALMSNIESMNKAVNANKQNIRKSQDFLQQTLDQSDAEARKVNAILYGINEVEQTKAIEQVKELLNNECFSKSPMPVSAFRLGAKKDNTTTPRPIKVKFNDEASKWEFVKRVNANLKSQRIFCKLDTSKEFRDKEYALRQRLQKLKADDSNQKYRIRDMQIQSLQSDSGNWVVVKPAQNQTNPTTTV